MNLEIEINKEIMDYDAQVVSGLTRRRLTALLLAVVLTIIVHLTLGKILSPVIMCFVYVPCVIPSYLIGWHNMNGLPGEKAIMMKLRYYLTPKVLTLKPANFYLDCMPLAGELDFEKENVMEREDG